ncbi:hypothetical protein PWY87_17350 [Kribbella solani]|uniref:DUF3592 domain-containing protein n=1 Tax=Kribbella solani TaxID=236067 RepID=UPI0029AA3EC0|nr:DUF3592 domain-containing protein [Kribbella solani]MDX3003457.1 hypothetical protein [Kribbella solani]
MAIGGWGTRGERVTAVVVWLLFTAMAAGVLAGGVAIAMLGRRALRDVNSLGAHHEQAVGRVVAKHSYPNGPQSGDKTEVTIGFTAADGSWHTTTRTLQLWSKARNVGDTVTVSYDSGNPADFVTGSIGWKRTREILTIAVGVVLTLGTPVAYVATVRDTFVGACGRPRSSGARRWRRR